MIPQVIITVGGGNVKNNPCEKFLEIVGYMIGFTVGSDEFRQLRIAGVFCVNMTEHRHGRGKKTSLGADSIKPLHQECMIPTAYLHEAGVWCCNTTPLRKVL